MNRTARSDRATGQLLAVVGAVVGLLAGIVAVRRARRGTAPELFAPDGPPARPRTGQPEDRGRTPTLALDLQALRTAEDVEPVVQYLTYIQEQRGEDSHLLFVRYDDLDAMAELDGQPTAAFLERLDQLGVVVSTN